MSDLIERLERWGRDEGLQNHFIGSRSARKDCAEAATALAEAAAEIERLREALAPCAAILAQQGLPEGRVYLIGGAFRVTVSEALDKANAALA